MKKVCWLTATCGRHDFLERNVRMFLDQDYENKIMLIYQNSDKSLSLSKELLNEKIILINRCVDSRTGNRYNNLGDIYNDAILFIPEDVDVVNMADDDDIFLPNHLSAGMKGFDKAEKMGMQAYKPKFSYYHSAEGVSKMCNYFEPSIFVDKNHLLKHRFYNNTLNQHHKWLSALGDKILVDEKGISTLIYDWNTPFDCFKTSGNPDNPENFNNYKKNSVNHGDLIITPVKSAEKYYKLVQNLHS